MLLFLRGDFKAAARARGIKKDRTAGRGLVQGNRTAPDRATTARPESALTRFREIVRARDGCIAATPEALLFYRQPGRSFHSHAVSVGRSALGFFASVRRTAAEFSSERANGMCRRAIICAALVLALRDRANRSLFSTTNRSGAAKLWRRSACPDSCASSRSRIALSPITCAKWRGTRSSSSSTTAPCRARWRATRCFAALPCVGGERRDRSARVSRDVADHGRSLGELARDLADATAARTERFTSTLMLANRSSWRASASQFRDGRADSWKEFFANL